MMSHPSQTIALLQQGIALTKAGRQAEARQALEQVLEVDERNEQAWLWLSGVADSLEERRNCLENVLAINPANTAAQRGLHMLDAQRASWPTSAPTEAEDVCPRCGAHLPPHGKDCPACHLPLIITCPGCGEYVDVGKASCPHCGEHIGDLSTGVHYYLQLAEAYLKRSHFPQAKEILGLAESEAAKDVQALARIAAMYENLDLSRQAVALYERIIRLNPSDLVARVHLIALHQQHGLAEQAHAIYQQALQHSDNPTEFPLALARQYLTKESSYEKGIETLRTVVRQSPKHSQAHMMLGRAYQRQRKDSLAIEHYRQVVEWSARGSKLSQEAQRRLDELQVTPAFQLGTGWGETARHMIGLLLPPVMAAWVNGRLTLLGISPVAWLALLAACAGAYLWVSATDVPKNPGIRQLFGQAGLNARDKIVVELLGGLLWMLAFGLILAKL
jgi:tetratricopeptide (TPR) repeat protein